MGATARFRRLGCTIPTVVIRAYKAPRAKALTASLVLGLLIPNLFAACGSTPSPSLPAPSPTSAPSPTGARPSPTASALSHATGATDVLLRYGVSGGYTVQAAALMRVVPRFTLLGDGTVISYDPSEATAVAGAPLHRATMTEDQIQALLTFALDEGGLRSAAAKIEPPGIVADAATTSFTIDAGGIDRTVQVYALGTQSPPPNDTWAELQALAARLGDVPALVAAGGATDAGRFLPTAYRAYLLPGDSAGIRSDWPWQDVAPEDFRVSDETTVPSATLTVDQARALAAEPGAGIAVPVVGPDRAPYDMVLIPLLPDQVP